MGKNTVTWWRSQRKALRLELCNPPAGGITGWTFAFYLYDSIASDAALLFTKTTGFSITEAGGNGQKAVIELLFDATDFATIAPGTYYHKWVNASDGIPIDYGPFILNP